MTPPDGGRAARAVDDQGQVMTMRRAAKTFEEADMSGDHRLFTGPNAHARLTGMGRAARAIVSALVLAAPVMGLPGSTGAQSATQTQAQCELSAIGNTRSAFAIQTIRSACNWLALNGDSLLNESLKGYYLCLVQNLSGAQSDAAAGAIVSSCRAANPR
jgi:hypothetical protein